METVIRELQGKISQHSPWLVGVGGADFKAGGLKRRNSKRLWDGGP